MSDKQESEAPTTDRRQRSDPPGWVPVPDPTALTTEAMAREVSSLREVLESRMKGERERLDALLVEREARHVERWEAQQLAITSAFQAAEKAVAAALDTREKAVQAAFDSAEKAILKAETSIEKRADATYVALNELQRLLAGLMPKGEALSRYEDQEKRLQALGSRLDRIEGKAGGVSFLAAGLAAGLGLLIAVVAIIVSLSGG